MKKPDELQGHDSKTQEIAHRVNYILTYHYNEWRKSAAQGKKGILYIGRKEFEALAMSGVYGMLDCKAGTIYNLPFIQVLRDSYLRYA